MAGQMASDPRRPRPALNLGPFGATNIMRLLPSRHAKGTRRRITLRALATVVIGAMTLVQGCGSDATGPKRGTLSGNVLLQDTFGNELDDFSGVAVTVDGTPGQSVTDKSGNWRIDDFPAGRYDITLKKATFGTMRILNVAVVGASTTVPKITMAVTPTYQAIVDSIYVGTLSGMEFYFIDGHLTAPPPANAKLSVAVVFLSTKSDAVSSDPKTYEQWNASLGLGAGSTFKMALPVVGTRSTFGQGTQVFVAGYATSAACSCYDDPATKNRVFSNAGPRGNVARFTVK